MTRAAADFPVVDAHFHVWRQADLPWLTGPMQPRIFGPYEPIRRDYPIDEYRSDLAGTGVAKAVYVQANWPPERARDEVGWVASLADRTGWPHGIVGHADMTASDIRPALDALIAAAPCLKGIRQQFHWHENPLYRFAPHPHLCAAPAVRDNMRRLGDYGLVFELQVFSGQMKEAADLAAAAPGTTLVLQHAGMPEDTSEAGLTGWEGALRHLAVQPNVHAKLSGFGTFIHRNDPAFIADITARTIAAFGPDRCLFGSNFPIEKLWTDYASLLESHRAAITAAAPDRAKDILHDNACRIYRLADEADRPGADGTARHFTPDTDNGAPPFDT